MLLTADKAGDNQQLVAVLDAIRVHKGGPGRPRKKSDILIADKADAHDPTGAGLRRRGRSKRIVPLPSELVPVLERHRIEQERERALAGEAWQEHDLVFTQPDGSPVDPRRDWADWKELLAVAGVRDARVHDGRHTAGPCWSSRVCTSGWSRRSWVTLTSGSPAVRARVHRRGDRRRLPDGAGTVGRERPTATGGATKREPDEYRQ